MSIMLAIALLGLSCKQSGTFVAGGSRVPGAGAKETSLDKDDTERPDIEGLDGFELIEIPLPSNGSNFSIHIPYKISQEADEVRVQLVFDELREIRLSQRDGRPLMSLRSPKGDFQEALGHTIGEVRLKISTKETLVFADKSKVKEWSVGSKDLKSVIYAYKSVKPKFIHGCEYVVPTTCVDQNVDGLQPKKEPLEIEEEAFEVRIFSASSDRLNHPSAAVTVPRPYRVVGGGATTDWSDAGSLLTASYPKDDRTWFAAAKDHESNEPTVLTVYAVGIKFGADESTLDASYRIISQASPSSRKTVAEATVPEGYTLLGGGAKIDWQGAGHLLIESYPDGDQWKARGTDHGTESPGILTSYAIAVRTEFLLSVGLKIKRIVNSSHAASHSSISCQSPDGVVISGGGFAESEIANRFLTRSFPKSQTEWFAESKDHNIASPGKTTCAAIVLAREP